MNVYLPTCSVAASSQGQLVWIFPPADYRQGGSKTDRGGIREHRRPAASRLVGPLRPDAPGCLARPRHSSHQPGAQQLRLDIIISIIFIRSKRHIVVTLILVHRPSDRRPVLSSGALPSGRPPVGGSATATRPRRHHPPGALGRHHRAGHDDQDAALARPRGRPGPTRWPVAGGGSTTILAATATATGPATGYWLATAAETHERVFSCRLLVSCPERKDEEEAGWSVKELEWFQSRCRTYPIPGGIPAWLLMSITIGGFSLQYAYL